LCCRRAVSVQAICFSYRLDNDGESQPTDIAQPLSARALMLAGMRHLTICDICAVAFPAIFPALATIRTMNKSGYSHNAFSIAQSSARVVAPAPSNARSGRCWHLPLLRRLNIAPQRSNSHESATPSARKMPHLLAGPDAHDLRNI
ncbi:hypothetical protein U1839_16830, partial [Sphingomonas sp. RT2P30]|uniref:hypothetical protein n=1 Tax=Parasphingomonas halimpatiens TaxID=3096162 RepID=UPI002FCB4748